jgi:hypothetical protein
MAKSLKRLLAVAFVAALPCACSAAPQPPINPDVRIQSTSPDDLPPTQTSGLGTPGGDVDAGRPGAALPDAAPPR